MGVCECKPGYLGKRCEKASDCLLALGVESSFIANWQMTGSSSMAGSSMPYSALLNNQYTSGQTFGIWRAKREQAGEYLQVDLLVVKNINKVATQGNPSNINSRSLN
ncbi:uncharacterized protein LOC116601521 [Nematostella vectensis]|uniref:uncharacterized protein LOC116601521 n=1 Tax=Nematostella vectensis TaxID=45351 RepID=UPI002077656C|nr:uncharacterized protein LOC116601521 [Nematostella vectensis]